VDDWEVSLKAGEKFQKVFDVWAGKVLSNFDSSTDDLVLWEAEKQQPAR